MAVRWKPLAERLALLKTVAQRRELGMFVENVSVAMLGPVLMRLALPTLDDVLERWFALGRARHTITLDAAAANALAAIRFGRPFVRHGCLVRGLTLYSCLRRVGFEAELVFAIGKANTVDGFDGHCWVALDGEPYGEPRDPRAYYFSMYRIGRRKLNAL
jgi:Transglutaminase-like superfamily